MAFTTFINVFIPLVLMILVGYISKRIGILKSEDVKPLNKIVVNIALPSLVFVGLYHANLSHISSMFSLTLLGLVACFATGTITFLILTYKKIPWSKKWSLMLPVMMGQTAFLGYPIVKGIWGDQGLALAVIYDISTYTIFAVLNTILTIQTHRGSNQKTIQSNDGSNQKNVINAIKKVIYLPILWGIFLGITLNLFYVKIGPVISSVVNHFSEGTVLIVMILTGLSLDPGGIRKNFKMVTLISMFQLILLPFIVFVCGSVIGLHDLKLWVPIVEAAMPCAIIALALSVEHDLDYNITSDCIVMSTIFSLITIPILLYFIPIG
jgi:auxin efflux carrier (AEC)